MPFVYADRVRETSTTTGTGTLTLSGAVTGFQTFSSAIGANNTCFYVISHRSAAEYEVGFGTVGSPATTLARTSVIASSNSNAAVNFSAGTKDVFVTQPAQQLGSQGINVTGGRLTTESGVPSSTDDRLSQGTIYFTPYLSNIIWLYSTFWRPITFSEKSLSLSGITTGKPYDIYGYLSSGDLALESLAWTNDTTRATALARQDGVWVKSGDATRLYLGTIYPSAANVTEDSSSKRYVFSQYNRIKKHFLLADATSSWTYASTTRRIIRGQSGNAIHVVCGERQGIACVSSIDHDANGAGGAFHGIGYKSGLIGSSTDFTTGALVTHGCTASMLNVVMGMTATFSAQATLGVYGLCPIEWQNVTTFTSTYYGAGRQNLAGIWPC